jgi:hypothetical protein
MIPCFLPLPLGPFKPPQYIWLVYISAAIFSEKRTKSDGSHSMKIKFLVFWDVTPYSL